MQIRAFIAVFRLCDILRRGYCIAGRFGQAPGYRAKERGMPVSVHRPTHSPGPAPAFFLHSYQFMQILYSLL